MTIIWRTLRLLDELSAMLMHSQSRMPCICLADIQNMLYIYVHVYIYIQPFNGKRSHHIQPPIYPEAFQSLTKKTPETLPTGHMTCSDLTTRLFRAKPTTMAWFCRREFSNFGTGDLKNGYQWWIMAI